MSSTTWKARPTAAPYSASASQVAAWRAAAAPGARWPAAPGAGLAAIRRARRARPGLADVRPGRWPGRRPCRHGRRTRHPHTCTCSAAATAPSSGVSASKASACIASPASIAWACPYSTCTVGLPRRSTSLSAGVSSWTASRRGSVRRRPPHAARPRVHLQRVAGGHHEQRARRLPPSSRSASPRPGRPGPTSAPRRRARPRSPRARADQASNSDGFMMRPGLELALFEHSLSLDGLQPRAAGTYDGSGAAPVAVEQLVERHLAGLHRLHEAVDSASACS